MNHEFDESEGKKVKQFITISRINHMTPTNPKNMENFINNYKGNGKYIIAPAYFENPSVQPKLFNEYGILKCNLRIVPAWKLTENDPDICAIDIKDTPFIPKGISNPPIIDALKKIKERRKI